MKDINERRRDTWTKKKIKEYQTRLQFIREREQLRNKTIQMYEKGFVSDFVYNFFKKHGDEKYESTR